MPRIFNFIFFNIEHCSYSYEQTNLFIQEFENTLYSKNLLYEYKVSRLWNDKLKNVVSTECIKIYTNVQKCTLMYKSIH